MRRLGWHPSVVIWGGNNEVEASMEWYEETRSNQALYAVDYDRLFVETVGGAVRQMAPSTPFVDSSPSNGMVSARLQVKRWSNPQDPAHGDVHYYNYGADCQVGCRSSRFECIRNGITHYSDSLSFGLRIGQPAGLWGRSWRLVGLKTPEAAAAGLGMGRAPERPLAGFDAGLPAAELRIPEINAKGSSERLLEPSSTWPVGGLRVGGDPRTCRRATRWPQPAAEGPPPPPPHPLAWAARRLYPQAPILSEFGWQVGALASSRAALAQRPAMRRCVMRRNPWRHLSDAAACCAEQPACLSAWQLAWLPAVPRKQLSGWRSVSMSECSHARLTPNLIDAASFPTRPPLPMRPP